MAAMTQFGEADAMTYQRFSIALAGLFLAGSIGCCGPYRCGTCTSVGVPCGVSRGVPATCATTVDCGCFADMTCEACRPRLRDCLPLFGVLFGCSGCPGDIYWNEWFSDPPNCSDPCDRCGNWTGVRAGSCSTCESGTMSPTPILEPTPISSDLGGRVRR